MMTELQLSDAVGLVARARHLAGQLRDTREADKRGALEAAIAGLGHTLARRYGVALDPLPAAGGTGHSMTERSCPISLVPTPTRTRG
jgi:hypothetical protein